MARTILSMVFLWASPIAFTLGCPLFARGSIPMQLARIIAVALMILGISVFIVGGGLLFLRRQQQYNDWMRESGRYDSPWFAGPRSKFDRYTYHLMFTGTTLILSSLGLVELSGN